MSEQAVSTPAPVQTKPKSGLMNTMFGHGSFKFWSLVPLLAVLSIFTLLPLFQLFRMSVMEMEFVEGELVSEYVGLKYFGELAKDPIAGIAIKNTIIYVIIAVTIETILGFSLALAVSRTSRLSVLYRSVIIIPLLIPPVAIGTMWSLMYDYNYGIINKLLTLVGVQNPPLWTADPNLALLSVVIVDVWHWTSFLFLIMLAGIESLPPSLLEAARADGANERQLLRHVILPLMMPTIMIAMMLRTILAFKVFDQIFVLTSGGPGTATQVISMHIYRVFSEQFRLGYSSFLSLLTALIMTVFVVAYLWANAEVKKKL